ncbi:unnamed protein product [Peronospora farinosa]|uniref:Centrosomin N-terminal motif 1 domain-containing protein n=1 Tax=Peronospora farinosa TaxID=134698 RepID=A0AAV0UNV1_9STRA|nr:unnamed protein product [Peronospora farinosa]
MQSPQRVRNQDDLNMTSTPTHDHSTLLREQEAERERLRMDNFNQALRINFLEERLLRMKQGTDFASEDLETELAQLRITLEERDYELRQRNFSMIRATEALDMLHGKLQEAQETAARARKDAQKEAQAQLQQHLEERGSVDAEMAEKWRLEVETTRKREQVNLEKIQQLEQEVERQRKDMRTLMTQMQELKEVRMQEQRQVELTSQREQQKLQQMEMDHIKISAEAEHYKIISKQRDEQVTVLQLQIETMRQENQTLDDQYQVKLKRMEEQVQQQMQQLHRESENYRTEHTRLLTDREKAHFDKERLAMENESIQQERVRLQAEIERIVKERQQLVGETERLRLQNVKLTAASEEQIKSIDSMKADQDAALNTIQQLESQLHQRRKVENEHELTIKTLESRLKHAEVTEKSRLAMVNGSMKQECARLQAETERMTKKRQQLSDETERLRLENVKLTTTCEELTKSLDGFKTDREATIRTINQLESELHQRRILENEHEVTVKRLENQLEIAEAEACKMKEQCELAESRCQQTSNERLLALEKNRQGMEEDNRRLREELSGFQMELEVMEHKLQISEAKFSNEAANAQEQCHRLSVYQRDLERQSAQLQEYQKQLGGCEDELTRRATRVQDLERQLAQAGLVGSSTSTAAREQLKKSQNQFAMEKSKILRQLDGERRRAYEAERAAVALKNENMSKRQELEAVEKELRLLLSSRSVTSSDRRHQTVASLAREAILALKNDFKAEATAVQTRWKQQTSVLNSKLEGLTAQLRASQSKLEALQSTSLHAENAKQSCEKKWSLRYEKLRMRKEEERQSLEEEIRIFQSKMTKAEEALSRARSDILALKRSSREEAQYDVHALKESNRLLFEEVQERRKSAKHAQKQYMQAVRENKELLKAIATYKDAIAGRDKDIEKYKSAVMKHAQQLQRRVEFGEVNQTLLEQLEQTQYMITETYKRWEDSPIVRGSVVGASDREESHDAAMSQLDEYIGRMHLVSERWGDFMKQSHELHRRYGKVWKTASRGFDRTKDQPRWVDDVERKCSRLLTEAVRVSEAMRDAVNNIAGILQTKHNEKKRIKKEGVVPVDKNAFVKQRDDTSSAWPSRDSDFLSDRLRPSRSVHRPTFESPTKKNGFDAPCRNSKTSTSARRTVNAVNDSSLSSLVRVGIKVQDLEIEIRSAHD